MRKLIILIAVAAAAFLALCPGLARGVDTGFRPDRDGFAFPNFGDAEQVAGIGLDALVGKGFHDDIFCHTGHCFGMARASVENFLNGASSMSITKSDATPYIDQVQTGQSFYYIGDFFRWPFGEKQANNTAEYARLLARLSAGTPAVIGIYPSEEGYPGHAVVAYRVEQQGGRAYIYVYDPNLPATLHDYEAEPMVAVFDPENGTFFYDNGHVFDEMRLDDVDGAGIAFGQTLSAGMLGVPCTALAALLVMRPRSKK